MYALEEKKGFIVINGSDIISGEEALQVCKEINSFLEKDRGKKLLVDFREVDLQKSKFDIFINYLSRLKINKIALILDQLLTRFKFSLWSRKYKPQIKIEQFSDLDQAENWLLNKSITTPKS